MKILAIEWLRRRHTDDRAPSPVVPAHVARAGRREILSRLLPLAGAIALAPSLVQGHTPYRQWQVYRQRHLMIGTSREDEPTYALGKHLVAGLIDVLPSSSARVTRARTVYRLASLLNSRQLGLVLLSPDDAREVLGGSGRFSSIGPTPLVLVAQIGDHLLISRPDFPAHHAWRLANAFLRDPNQFPPTGIPAQTGAPFVVHPGSARARDGLAEPEHTPTEPEPDAHPHRH